MNMEFHPAANLFPLIDGDDFAALVEDVRANGLQEDIRLLGGKILDGRNRYRACEAAGVKPRYRKLPADTAPIQYVVSANLHRRHLSTSQRAAIAAEIANMEVGQNKSGFSPSHKCEGEKKSPVSQKDAAEMMNVSPRAVSEAVKAKLDAIPEIVQMVKEGKLSVKSAMLASDLPDDEQREAAKGGPDEVKKKAAEIRRQKQAGGSPNGVHEPAGQEAAGATAAQPREKIKSLGVGVRYAHEAINSLTRIPKNDALRKQGFRLVTDWIRHNP